MSVDTNPPLNPDDLSGSPENWKSVGAQLAAGAFPGLSADGIADMIANGISKALNAFLKGIALGVTPIARAGGKALVELEEPILPIFAEFVAPIVSNMFGTPADASLFSSRDNREGRGDAARALVDAYMSSLAGDADGEIEPGDEGSKRVATAGVHAAIEGWFNSWILEMLGECVPWEWLHFTEMTKFPEEVISALGIGRLTRRALTPLVNATATVPMTWATHKKYRPTLLSEADILRAFMRGDYDAGEAAEELSRLGYSDRRQDMLLKNALKFLPPGDLATLQRAKVMSSDEVLANVRAQGFDDVGARAAVLVENIKHLNSIRDDSVAALRAAYVDRRIDESQLRTYLTGIFDDDDEIALHVTAMQTIRGVNTKRLAPSQAEECVLAGVLPIAAYREALTLDGYDDEAVLALELLLETKIQKNIDVETIRKQKAEQAAVDAAAKKAAALEKQQQVDDARALARRGSLADLRRAVVRGLIPISRLVEVLAPQYDADTVGTLVDLVAADRADFVAQQQAADDAKKRAALRHVDVGQYEAAVINGVLTIEQFRAAIVDLKFAPADVDVLVNTLAARKADLDKAKAQHAAAAEAATRKSIDLGRFEQLVRRGHRSLSDYDALLASLGYDAGARAAMGELLQLQINDDAAARKLRADDAAKNAARGLSLEQARRAVVLGLSSIDDFAHYLQKNKYDVDAQATLLNELRNDVTEADAARRKREAVKGAGVDTQLPLSTVARAARLGIITPAAYRQRLTAAGYSADDIAIDSDLLAAEIADAQQQRARAAAAEAKTTDRGLSLDQAARAVKLGALTIDDYRARAVELGYAADDVETLIAVLTADVQTIQDAQARHSAIDGQLHARNLSLSELDAAVKAGQMTIDAYTARLLELGYGDDDAQLLTTLLTLKLSPTGSGG